MLFWGQDQMMARRSAAVAVASASIAAWFLYFAWGGLWAPLSGDDIANLHEYLQKPAGSLIFDNFRYWSTAYRPLGGLFYVPLYKIFGVHPFPYRVACFVLLGANLILLHHFCWRLTASREVAMLGTFLVSYHAWFVDLYYSAGTIYDLLCYAFYLGGFLVYIGIRSRGRAPRAQELLGISVLYILALDAKEMAVTLPLLLLIYESIFHTAGLRNPRTWLMHDLRAVWITGALTVVYMIGKLTGPGSLVENPAYSLTISPVRFLHTFHVYLNPLLYQEYRFHDSNTAQLLIAMLAFAIVLRSRVLMFGWFWLVLTTLPVAFINHYSGFFEYLPAVGWALYAVTLLVLTRRALIRWLPQSRILGRASQFTLFVSVAAFLAPLHARESRKTLQVYMSAQPPSREIAQDLARLQPTLRHSARLLFVDDPFPTDSYFLLFVTRLHYHDMTIQADRTRLKVASPSDYPYYDVVFGFQGRQLVRLSTSGTQR
jgi:hypothetical protein